MGIMVYSLLWVMQDFVHQPKDLGLQEFRIEGLGLPGFRLLGFWSSRLGFRAIKILQRG